MSDPRASFLLGADPPDISGGRQPVVNNCVIVEREGKWYARSRFNVEEMICDAPIKISYVTMYEGQTEATFVMSIFFQNTQV